MNHESDWENILYKARVDITDNPNFNDWYGTLTPHVRQILDDLLDHNVTPEMINDAQDATKQEWDDYTFIRAIGGGNPSPTVANDLTDVVLEFLPWDIDFGEI